MATIGLDRLFYSKITEGAGGYESYSAPISLAKAIQADLAIELAEAVLYADDGALENYSEFKSGTLTLGINDIGAQAAQDLTGAIVDNNGAIVSAGEDSGDPVAIGFRAKKADGSYRYFWLYRVTFGIPATNLATKGDSITFSTPTIEGTVMRRNKPDTHGKHPWKAEVNETADNRSIIADWFSSVYEPNYGIAVPTITISVQPQNVTVREGTVSGSLSVTASASDNSVLSYQWYSNTAAVNSGGSAISGATSASYTLDASLSQGSYYYYCTISSPTADSVVSNVATVTVSAPGVMLAAYNLVGEVGGVASSYTDTSGNGNTLTAVGTVTNNSSGYPIVNAAGQALSLESVNLDGHTSYNIHMEINSTNGWNQQHRIMHVTDNDLQFLLASSTERDPISGNAYQIIKLETSDGTIWSSGNMLPYMYRPNFRRALIDVSVTNDVLTISFTAYDSASHTTTVTDSVQVEGFTAALANGVYLMNRFDGDRPLGGSLTSFYIETL